MVKEVLFYSIAYPKRDYKKNQAPGKPCSAPVRFGAGPVPWRKNLTADHTDHKRTGRVSVGPGRCVPVYPDMQPPRLSRPGLLLYSFSEREMTEACSSGTK